MKRGVLITILILVIILILLALGAGFIYLQLTREPHIAENSFLKITLNGDIVDNDTSFLSQKESIRDLWYHIQRAKKDHRVKGILLKISFLNTGLAKVEDIGRMIADFRGSGKKVIAYIEGGGLREYFLATFADEVTAFKGGSLFLNGLAAEAIFLKDSLSKLGIEAQFYHMGKYKTASNMFTENRMTGPHRESLQTLLDDIFDATLDKIAANRGLDKAVIRKEVEEYPFSNRDHLEKKLLDRLVYEDEILDEIEQEARVVDFEMYKETSSPLPYSGSKKIAVIFAGGEIRSGHSGENTLFGGEVMGSETVVRQIRTARQNPSVKAVVLRVDSPGGSPFASDSIRREIELTLKEKPLVISMSDLAASGGYQLSLSASRIIGLPQTLTGSIGVLGGKFVLKGLYDKIGLKKATVTTSPHADMFSDYRKFSPPEQKKYIAFMKEIYDSFVELVAKSRGIDPEEVEEIAQGRVWAGQTALKLRLIDQLGGLVDALDAAAELAGFEPREPFGVNVYPREKSMWDVIQEYLGPKAKINPVMEIQSQVRQYKKLFPALMVPYRLQFN